jgi:hypothetical protein
MFLLWMWAGDVLARLRVLLSMMLLLIGSFVLLLPVGLLGIRFRILGFLFSFLGELGGLCFLSSSVSLIVYCIAHYVHAQHLNTPPAKLHTYW